ncbi:hypothetical protein [Microbacterium sp. SA39]|uniref:hypothetical protein n=1 Tax=Microbacterium sp. SA39 TaxID=1263625 RepID=UPI0005F9E87E|nr:hypothetical protein [Microbacterium sp. SA39]KJQ55572.1 hypothetical protein RS85_00636 [Microbacterium sp. SA39]
MNTSLSRSIGFWLLLVVSLVTTAVGGWLISSQIGTMTTTLLDGTATGVEVYVGQSLVVVGAGVLAAGIIGILLALGLVAARSLVRSPATSDVEAIDWSAEPEATPTPAEAAPATDAADEVADGVTPDSEQKKTDDAETIESAPAVTR